MYGGILRLVTVLVKIVWKVSAITVFSLKISSNVILENFTILSGRNSFKVSRTFYYQWHFLCED